MSIPSGIRMNRVDNEILHREVFIYDLDLQLLLDGKD